MSEKKDTVQRFMEAFARSDHAGVLACLTDDVEWGPDVGERDCAGA